MLYMMIILYSPKICDLYERNSKRFREYAKQNTKYILQIYFTSKNKGVCCYDDDIFNNIFGINTLTSFIISNISY